MYPEDSVQSLVAEWWVGDGVASLSRGSLVRTFVPYPEMKPHRLVAVDRGEDPRQHDRAQFLVEAFRMGDPPPPAGTLPVAAMPLREGEVYYVQRGKVRPALVLSVGGVPVSRQLRAGRQHWQSAPTFLVAPYYGAEADSTRGGWPAPFVERIRHAEYPQYMWEVLPHARGREAILRLDHTFAIGTDPAGFELLGYHLSDEALVLLDDWIAWLMRGQVGGELATVRELLA